MNRNAEQLPGKLLTAEQVAEITGWSPWTVRKMARDGRLPARYMGRAIRFPETEIRAFIDQLPRVSA